MTNPAYALIGPVGAWLAIRLGLSVLEDLDHELLGPLLEQAFGCTLRRKDGRP